MCTAATYLTEDFYFGRTLDYEFAYGEEVVVTPRNHPFSFRHTEALARHYAIIGMAHVAEGFPLYYDGVNEKGLCMAGLNLAQSARYGKPEPGRVNVAQFEFIPWLLGRCATLEEARARLGEIALVDTPFSDRLPVAKLHWMVADRTGCLVVESTGEGLRVYDDPAGVLTNEPPFPQQLFNLNNYMGLSSEPPVDRFGPGLSLTAYSRGMGGLGLPGDLSSMSRFVRAAFVRQNSQSGTSEEESVSQFFHILGAVDQQRGCCRLGDGQCEVTIYTSCCNACKGIYYYNTYDNHQLSAVEMHKENLESETLSRFPLVCGERIFRQN